MNQSNSNFIFNWNAAVLLILGFCIPYLFINIISRLFLFFWDIKIYEHWIFFLLSNVILWGIPIFTFSNYVCKPQTGKKLSIDVKKTNFTTLSICTGLLFSCILITEYLTSLIPTTGPVWGDMYHFFTNQLNLMSENPAVLIVLAVVMAPIFEEIVFRGILQKGLINNKVSPTFAIIISAILFGIVHFNPWQFVGATLIGSLMGWLYYKTKSLLVPIFLHFFNNLISSILYLKFEDESLAQLIKIPEHTLLLFGILSFLVFLILIKKHFKTIS